MIVSDNVPLLINRIILGKLIFEYNNCWYILYSPSCEIKYEAELLYEGILSDNRFDDWWRKDGLDHILSRLGLWQKEDDKIIDKVQKNIESNKLSLYLNRLNASKVKSIRKDLSNYKDELNRLFGRKHSLDYLTLEDFANHKKNEYIITKSLFYKDNTQVFPSDSDNIDYNLFENLANTISYHMITIETYKKIARHESWKMIWYANKSNIFDRPSSLLTEEQKTIISISNMYDKIYEHPECPPESVIDDDDMLDGWMIEQKRKNEAAKKGNNTTLANKHNNAKEIFVVGDREDVSEINSLNSLESQHIIKRRNKLIQNSTDGVDEINLPDVQQELLLKLNTRK